MKFTYLSVSVEICKLIKLAPDSLAIALANIVFPHPGGPYNKIPFGLLNNDEV